MCAWFRSHVTVSRGELENLPVASLAAPGRSAACLFRALLSPFVGAGSWPPLLEGISDPRLGGGLHSGSTGRVPCTRRMGDLWSRFGRTFRHVGDRILPRGCNPSTWCTGAPGNPSVDPDSQVAAVEVPTAAAGRGERLSPWGLAPALRFFERFRSTRATP